MSERMNIPNKLTVTRLFLCLLMIVFLELNWKYSGAAAFVIFIVASATDWLDGYLARRYGWITDFGKLLDPLADKVLISVTYVGLVARDLAPMWVVVSIIAREFLITGLRSFAASKGVILSAEKWGKNKTFSQMITALTALLVLAMQNMQYKPQLTAQIERFVLQPLFWVTLVITVYSGLVYYFKNRKLIFEKV